MSLLERAKRDWNRIVSSKREFSVSITIENPVTRQVVQLIGLHTKHWFKVDYDSGLIVNTRNAHISISERELISHYFDYRNERGEIYIKDFIIRVADSSGIEKLYKITQQWPDETIGVIVCQLGDYIPSVV